MLWLSGGSPTPLINQLITVAVGRRKKIVRGTVRYCNVYQASSMSINDRMVLWRLAAWCGQRLVAIGFGNIDAIIGIRSLTLGVGFSCPTPSLPTPDTPFTPQIRPSMMTRRGVA